MDDRRQEGRPDDWLFHILTRIEDQQTRHALEVRAGMHEIHATLSKHFIDDALVAADVREMKKRMEKTSAAKHHLKTLLFSTGLVAFWEGTKHYMGWR